MYGKSKYCDLYCCSGLSLQFLFIHGIEIYLEYTILNKCVKHEMLFTTLHLFNVYIPFFLLSLLSTRQIDLKDSFLSSAILLLFFFSKNAIKFVLLNKNYAIIHDNWNIGTSKEFFFF